MIISLLSYLFNIKHLEIVFTLEDIEGAHTYDYVGGFFNTDGLGQTKLSKAGIVVILPMSYMTDMNFTEGEMVAILIQKIGHSLNSSILNLLAKIPLISLKRTSSIEKKILLTNTAITTIPRTIPVLSVFYSKIVGGWQRFLSDFTSSHKFISEIVQIINSAAEILSTIQTIKSIASILSPPMDF